MADSASGASLPGWTASPFTHGGITRDVLRRGSGPGVVVMHEIPGITPQVAAFSNRVVDAGFTVWMPVLFGEVGRPLGTGYLLSSMARACVAREFSALAARRSSPIADYLRALARALATETGGPVGALGMCFTGNFALAMMVDDAVAAPVLSQPSLPFPIGAERRRGLHVSDEELVAIKKRVAGGCSVLGLRFTRDPAVPAERFARLREELGDGFEGIEIDSSPGNAHGVPRNAHSVLTTHLVDEAGHPTRAALERTLAFFRERLGEPPAPRGGGRPS
jgi:dienelactone hydrolase